MSEDFIVRAQLRCLAEEHHPFRERTNSFEKKRGYFRAKIGMPYCWDMRHTTVGTEPDELAPRSTILQPRLILLVVHSKKLLSYTY